MKTVISFLVFSFIHLNLFAAVPAPEGLFRNGNNADITSDEIYVSFSVEEKDKEGVAPKYFKLYFEKEKGSVNILKLGFNESQMKEGAVSDVSVKDGLKISSDDNITRELLFSTFDTLFFNSSVLMNKFLKKHSSGYMLNSEMLNREKLSLLYNYKEYLLKIERDPGIEKDLVSPLKPNDPKELENVNRIMKQDLYTISDSVVLEKINNELFWKVKLSGFNAWFSNEEHELRRVQFDKTEIEFNDFQLLDGIHKIPKYIQVTNGNGEKYLITFFEYENKNLKVKSLMEKYKSFRNSKTDRIIPILY